MGTTDARVAGDPVVTHVEILLEERSAAEAVSELIGRLLGESSNQTWHTQSFRGKPDLRKKLPQTLEALAKARYADGVIVLLDADNDDCVELKREIAECAERAGLRHRNEAGGAASAYVRIAVTELESWFIGDPEAAVAAFPRLNRRELAYRKFREPDAVPNASEWLERRLILKKYYVDRMPKVEVAGKIAKHLSLEPEHNTSRSFRLFLRTLREVYDLT